MKKKWERILVTMSDNLAEKNINSACFWLLYQPELPESLKKKYKK